MTLRRSKGPGDQWRWSYRGRASLIGELEKGNVSLKLENLTLAADTGEYVCYVKSLTWYESATVNLTVKGSQGLVRVSSWLLFSPSESEWISCSVGVSDQEVKEARVVPHKGFWREAFISILVVSLIIILIIIILTALLLVVRSGLFPHGLSCEHDKASGSQSSAPPVSPEERLKMWNKMKDNKEKLTVDPETRHRPLTITREGTGVYCGQPNSDKQSNPFPHVLSKEKFSSGLIYWEVKVDQKEKSKRSWCVGVTQKPPTKETLTALCYEEDFGIYTSTDPRTAVPAEGQVTTLGLLLDFKHRLLSFYNVDPPSHLHTFTMENMRNRTYCALISPGKTDKHPVSFHS
ncbi:hypothetical protein NFI96_008655 [Prochilodus magdalenae]|nr:hypothetical protein NFI96_008655 [Prochilodus magdalenae]